MTDKISENEDFIVRQKSRQYAAAPAVDALKVSGTTGQANFSQAPAVNGITMLPITGMVQKLIAGTDSSSVAHSITLAGVAVGDKVVSAMNVTAAPAVDVTADFESTISVAGHISQTSVNLSTATAILVTVLRLS